MLKTLEGALVHQIPALSKQKGLSIEWLSLWWEVEQFYGDLKQKESRDELLHRLQTEYTLTAK